MTTVEQVTQQHAEELLALPNVVGVGTAEEITRGQRTGRHCVTVFVTRKIPKEELAPGAAVPHAFDYAFDRIPTDVVEVGNVRPLSLPVYVGEEVGAKGGAGTLGLVYRLRGQDYGLTAGHVLPGGIQSAVSHPAPKEARYGNTQILIGHPPQEIGRLWMRIVGPVDERPNAPTVDAAAIELADAKPPRSRVWDRFIDFRQGLPNFPICGWWRGRGDYCGGVAGGEQTGISQLERTGPTGLARAQRDTLVWLPGARTGITRGRIISTDMVTRMRYGDESVLMRGQIAISGWHDMVAAGDSGTVPIDERGRAVGLLYAGSGGFAVASHIRPVLEALHGEDVRRVDWGELM